MSNESGTAFLKSLHFHCFAEGFEEIFDIRILTFFRRVVVSEFVGKFILENGIFIYIVKFLILVWMK